MTHKRGHKTRRRQRAGLSLFTSKPTFAPLSDPSKKDAALKTANTLQSAVVKFKDLPFSPGLINETTIRGCKGTTEFLPITTLPKPKNIDTSSVEALLSVNGTGSQVGQAETTKFLTDVLTYVDNCKEFSDEQLKNAYAAIDDDSEEALTIEQSCSLGTVVPKLRCSDADVIATRMAKMVGFLQYGVVNGGRSSRRRRGGDLPENLSRKGRVAALGMAPGGPPSAVLKSEIRKANLPPLPPPMSTTTGSSRRRSKSKRYTRRR